MSDFLTDYLVPFLWMAGQSILLLVILLVAVAYVLYADRKIWAAVQMRRGPNVVGPWGLLQSFADLLKSDPEVTRYLTPTQIDASFDTAYHLKHVDTIFRRVFGDAVVSKEKRDELAAQ